MYDSAGKFYSKNLHTIFLLFFFYMQQFFFLTKQSQTVDNKVLIIRRGTLKLKPLHKTCYLPWDVHRSCTFKYIESELARAARLQTWINGMAATLKLTDTMSTGLSNMHFKGLIKLKLYSELLYQVIIILVT